MRLIPPRVFFFFPKQNLTPLNILIIFIFSTIILNDISICIVINTIEINGNIAIYVILTWFTRRRRCGFRGLCGFSTGPSSASLSFEAPLVSNVWVSSLVMTYWSIFLLVVAQNICKNVLYFVQRYTLILFSRVVLMKDSCGSEVLLSNQIAPFHSSLIFNLSNVIAKKLTGLKDYWFFLCFYERQMVYLISKILFGKI